MKGRNNDQEVKLIKDNINIEAASELGLDDLDIGNNLNKRKYYNWVQSLPEATKVLLIISWVCAALAAFISALFAIPGVITAYIVNRIVPGLGWAAMVTNIVLGVLNIILSIAFLATIRNIFTLL